MAGTIASRKFTQERTGSKRTRSPLTEPGIKVKAGDYLIAVNGQEAKSAQEVYYYFQNLAGKLVTLKINSKPSADGAWEVVVKPVANESGARYIDWFAANRKKVEEATGGRIGYMYVRTLRSRDHPVRQSVNAQLDKDGIIIDERYNRAGRFRTFNTEKLKRQLLALVAPRDTKDIPGLRWVSSTEDHDRQLARRLRRRDAFPWFFRRKRSDRSSARAPGADWSASATRSRYGMAALLPRRASRFGARTMAASGSLSSTASIRLRRAAAARSRRPGRDPQLEKAIELAKEALKNYKPFRRGLSTPWLRNRNIVAFIS